MKFLISKLHDPSQQNEIQNFWNETMKQKYGRIVPFPKELLPSKNSLTEWFDGESLKKWKEEEDDEKHRRWEREDIEQENIATRNWVERNYKHESENLNEISKELANKYITKSIDKYASVNADRRFSNASPEEKEKMLKKMKNINKSQTRAFNILDKQVQENIAYLFKEVEGFDKIKGYNLDEACWGKKKVPTNEAEIKEEILFNKEKDADGEYKVVKITNNGKKKEIIATGLTSDEADEAISSRKNLKENIQQETLHTFLLKLLPDYEERLKQSPQEVASYYDDLERLFEGFKTKMRNGNLSEQDREHFKQEVHDFIAYLKNEEYKNAFIK